MIIVPKSKEVFYYRNFYRYTERKNLIFLHTPNLIKQHNNAVHFGLAGEKEK